MRVVKGLWRLLVGIKDGFVLLLMLLFFAGLYAALSLRPSPVVPASGALTIDFDGGLVEQPAEPDPLALISAGAPPTRDERLSDVVRGLDLAAADRRIKVVVLDLDRFTGGAQATIAAAGRAVDRVRRAGKPVLAFATGYADDGYQLAAHASEVWLDPLGAVLLAGPGGPRLYYKGLLDKLGVTTHVYRVGTFKSAVEPYIRSDQSPAARAANQALADALWAGWQAEVGAARPRAQVALWSGDPVAATAGAGGDFAAAAQARGLVDRLGDRIAFGRRVAALAGKGDRADAYRGTTLDSWLSAHPAATTGTPIGVLTVAGTIVDGEAPAGAAGGDTIARLILDELERKRIKALVVRIDSPGGSVTASERIRQAILEAKRQGLPVAVSMGGVAASGGYWIATPADRIFADPATITGSIGVFGLIPSFEGSLAKLGLSADGVATTPLSGQPDVFRGPSPVFDRLVQAGIENNYRRFVGLVAAARRMPAARVDGIAQGRVWPGAVARGLGLVDEAGDVEAAVAWAARAAKRDPAKVRIVAIERELNPVRAFLGDLLRRPERGGARDAWSQVATRPTALLARALADAREIAAGPAIQARCLDCGGTATATPAALGWLAALVAR